MVEDMVGQRGSLHNSQEVERARGLGETYPPFTHPAIICVTSHLVFLSVGVCQWICPLVKYVYHPITFNDWIHLLWGPNIQHMSPSGTLHIQTFSLPPPSRADEYGWSRKGWYREDILCTSEGLIRSSFGVMICSLASDLVCGWQPFPACPSWKLPPLRTSCHPRALPTCRKLCIMME